VGVVLALVLAACGGGGASGSAKVLATAGATTSGTTARVRTTTIGIENDAKRPGEKPVSLYSTGLVDFVGGDASIVMASDGDGPPATIETRRVGGMSYLRINREGSWMPSDGARLARGFPPAFGLLTGANGLGFGSAPDPSQWLGILDDLAGVHEEGHERIDGVATTRYGGKFDLRDELAKSAAGRKLRVPDDGPSDLDVWIDGAGRVRRLVVAIPSRHGPVLIRTDLTDFGVPVHVTAPSPSEVLHITPLPEGV
jgi:hypothetical protein